jgi:UDP-glucose 4-epimerase
MNILVTGGCGAIGRWVVQGLAQEGHRLAVFDQQIDETAVQMFGPAVGLTTGDINDTPSLERLCRSGDVDTIVHFASLLSKKCQVDPRLAVKVNVEGTVSVLEAARCANVRRVVYASSQAVFGPMVGRDGHPVYHPISEAHERTPWPGQRLYGATKTLAEDLGFHYAEMGLVQFVALRFATGMLIPTRDATDRTGSRVLKQIIDDSMAGQSLAVPQGGDQENDVVYVKDIAHAVHCAVSTPDDVSGSYNIGSGTPTSLHDVVAAVEQVLPEVDVTIGPGLDYMGVGPAYSVQDISHARERLGYAPRFNLIQAVADYVQERERWGAM